MKVSILVPAYNEQATILKTLQKVYRASLPNGFTREIIVINDGSSDTTGNLLDSQKSKLKVLHHFSNQGKGRAIRTGLEKSSGDLILIQDADLEYDPVQLKTLLVPFSSKKVKVVYGSRLINYPLIWKGKNKTPMPFHLIANRVLTSITNTLFNSQLTDMETCYKVIDRKLLLSLNLASNRFDIEPEITAKILKRGINIVEVPIRVTPRDYSEGKKITWKDGFIAIWTLLKYRFTN